MFGFSFDCSTLVLVLKTTKIINVIKPWYYNENINFIYDRRNTLFRGSFDRLNRIIYRLGFRLQMKYILVGSLLLLLLLSPSLWIYISVHSPRTCTRCKLIGRVIFARRFVVELSEQTSVPVREFDKISNRNWKIVYVLFIIYILRKILSNGAPGMQSGYTSSYNAAFPNLWGSRPNNGSQNIFEGSLFVNQWQNKYLNHQK